MLGNAKNWIRSNVPFVDAALRHGYHPRDLRAAMAFKAGAAPADGATRRRLARAFGTIHASVESGHSQRQLLEVADAILRRANVSGAIVEAGCFKGASGAKLSLVAAETGRKLHLFDSFEGIPPNDEAHAKNIFGGDMTFKGGDYAGSLDEVKGAIGKFGRLDICTFHKGWFDATMPNFRETIAVAYIDVDLRSSTATCLQHLFPLLSRGGVLFSQDGQVPLVVDLLRDEGFWKGTVGCPKPRIDGVGERQLIAIHKD
jgi:O-methyltransferase